MKPALPSVVFRRSDVDAFTKLSHDRNPLHIDAQYARRTPFGQCVVYGVLGVLAALRESIKGAPVKVRSLAARFDRPLFVDVPYELKMELPGHGRMACSLGRGGVTRLHVDVEYELGGSPWAADASSQGHARRREAAHPGRDELAEGKAFTGEYELAGAFLDELKKQLGFKYAFLPAPQLTALVWTSYFVGMEVPGQQALYTRCALDFTQAADVSSRRLKYDARVTRFDDETSTLAVGAELSGAQGSVGRVQLEAARRPPPVEYSTAALEARVRRSAALEGKLALVTGSSRGLGSLTALGCSLQGADVILHCREGRAEAERVAAQIAAWGGRSTLVQGDLEKPETWAELRSAVEAKGGGLDLFVDNAFPPLVPTGFAELTREQLDAYLRVVAATALGLQQLLPALVANKGIVVHVSSEAVARPPKDYSHYVTAKAALEGLVLSLAREYESVRFLTIRPPRLLTDMTNGIVGAFQGRSPEGVVAAILQAVSRSGAGNHAIVDAFD